MLNAVYTIYKIRNKTTGEIHERETRRQGHKLKIIALKVGYPMMYEYLEGGFMRTSVVEEINSSDFELEIRTLNTIYTFKKSQ